MLSPTLYSTCPPYRGAEPETYTREVRDVARWSEEGGCEGMLVYTDNGLLDPWLFAQLIIQNTAHLSPLVAVQPVYMHPYTVAKMVTTLSLLHRRRIDLNIVAGGFKNDLAALNDRTPHDLRYARLIEYTTIIRRLLEGGSPVTFKGEFYAVSNLSLVPPLDPELMPRILLSGSSAEGLAAARSLDALPVRYPGPPSVAGARQLEADDEFGIRVGIIGREYEEDAWAIARGSPGPGHSSVGDEGVGFGLAPATLRDRTPSARGQRVLDGALSELQDILPLSGRQLRSGG
jgi:alkanesulfonate monooxygenase